MRLSNFLLWQLAYAEIYVTQTLWPDFRGLQLLEGIEEYQKAGTAVRRPGSDADRANEHAKSRGALETQVLKSSMALCTPCGLRFPDAKPTLTE